MRPGPTEQLPATDAQPNAREIAIQTYGLPAVTSAEFRMRIGGIVRPIGEAAANEARWTDPQFAGAENWGE